MNDDEELEALLARLEAERRGLAREQAERVKVDLAPHHAALPTLEGALAERQARLGELQGQVAVLRTHLRSVGPEPWLGLAAFLGAATLAGGLTPALVTGVVGAGAWWVASLRGGRAR